MFHKNTLCLNSFEFGYSDEFLLNASIKNCPKNIPICNKHLKLANKRNLEFQFQQSHIKCNMQIKYDLFIATHRPLTMKLQHRRVVSEGHQPRSRVYGLPMEDLHHAVKKSEDKGNGGHKRTLECLRSVLLRRKVILCIALHKTGI